MPHSGKVLVTSGFLCLTSLVMSLRSDLKPSGTWNDLDDLMPTFRTLFLVPGGRHDIQNNDTKHINSQDNAI
jgi:hypothetical protein